MKKTVIMVFMLCCVATAALAGSGKIAYVDTQTVFDKTKLGQKYQGIVREYYESRKKILDMDAEEIQKAQDEYKKQAAVMNEKARKEKEDAINRKMGEFEKKRNEFSGEISKKNDDLSNDFNQSLIVVLKDIAKKEKVSMVLNKTINILSKGEVPAVLYADDDLNLTDKVIVELDKKMETK